MEKLKRYLDDKIKELTPADGSMMAAALGAFQEIRDKILELEVPVELPQGFKHDFVLEDYKPSYNLDGTRMDLPEIDLAAMADIIDELKKTAVKKAPYDDKDFDLGCECGGNLGDAWSLGGDQSEISQARSILDKLKISYNLP